jgi:uncharacterized cupin superfamily protein
MALLSERKVVPSVENKGNYIMNKHTPETLPLYPETMKKETLDSIPPFPKEELINGDQENWTKIIHHGEVVVALYESTPARIAVNKPFPYDEFINVLEGELILTHIDGNKQTFKAGDSVLLPKGWMGTWDMTEHFREMIVVETKAMEAAEG